MSACRQSSPAWHWERTEAGLPRHAACLALATDPTDPNRLWVGYYAPGGLAASSDGGQTWTTGAAGLGDNPVFDLLAFAGGHLWAATRGGLLQSTDGGASWHPVSAGLPPSAAFVLAADKVGHIYAGLDGDGLYREELGGGGWTSLASDDSTSLPHDDSLASAAILSLAVSPDGTQLYAGTAGHGLFASRDAGRTWSVAFPGAYVPALALDPSQPTVAIASLRDRAVRTGDGGKTWNALPIPWARNGVMTLLWIADPLAGTGGTLWAGSGQGRVYHSQDGGNSWVEGGTGLPAGGGVFALAMAGDHLLAGAWAGVYASDDGGQSWTYLSPSLGFPLANTLLATDAGPLLGTRTGLYRWQPAARRWTSVLGDEGFPPESVTALAAAPSDAQIIYAGSAGGGLYRSQDGGTSWARVVSHMKVGIRALAVAPADHEHLYMLAAGERVYESADGGQSWQARWAGLGVTTEAISLAIDPLDPQTLYLGADTGLYRSRYGGEDWRPVGRPLDDQTVLAIVARPGPSDQRRASLLAIGATRGVYRSADGGDTIQPWGRGLEGVSVTALLFDPDDPQIVYAGTAYAGLYRSLDGGETWQPTGPAGLADEIIETLAWGPADELFVASAGGVWMGSRE